MRMALRAHRSLSAGTFKRVAPCADLGFARLKFGHAGAGAVFVLLRRAAAHATGTLDGAAAQDRYRALAHDHVTAFRGGNPGGRRLARPFREFAAGTPESGRRDGFALAAIGARPDRVVHALERHQTAAGITYRHADLDVEFDCFRHRARDDAIGFLER